MHLELLKGCKLQYSFDSIYQSHPKSAVIPPNLQFLACTVQTENSFLLEERISHSDSTHCQLAECQTIRKWRNQSLRLRKDTGLCGEWRVCFSFLSPSNHKHRSFWSALEYPRERLGDSPEQWHISSLLNHRAISYVTNWLSLLSLLKRTPWLKEQRAWNNLETTPKGEPGS